MTPEDFADELLGGAKVFEAKDPLDAAMAEIATAGMRYVYVEHFRKAMAAARLEALEEAATIADEQAQHWVAGLIRKAKDV